MKKIIISNWKAYLSINESVALSRKIHKIKFNKAKYNIIVAPTAASFCCLKERYV